MSKKILKSFYVSWKLFKWKNVAKFKSDSNFDSTWIKGGGMAEASIGFERLLQTGVIWGNNANNTAGCNMKPAWVCVWAATWSLLTCCYSWEVRRGHGSKMMGTSPSYETDKEGEAKLGVITSVVYLAARLTIRSDCTGILKLLWMISEELCCAALTPMTSSISEAGYSVT